MPVPRRMIARMLSGNRFSSSSSSNRFRLPNPRITRGISSTASMMPFYTAVASARLVSGLSVGLVPYFEGFRACSTYKDCQRAPPQRTNEAADEESSGSDSYSDSDSLWSHDEDDSESGSDLDDEEGDTFVNDNDLWDDTEAAGQETKEEAQENEDKQPLSLEDLSRILPGLDPDATKKAEEKFRQQQGEEARVRREGDYYLNAMKKEYDARNLVQDEHCQKVLKKLAYLKPDPDGRYRNLMEVVSDTDILLEAYRRVKAGPGGDPSKVPLHNVRLEWFHETQAKLRDGSFKLRPIKVVEVEKREICRLERKKKVFRRAYRKKRQPF